MSAPRAGPAGADAARALFRQHFEHDPRVIASAPGRVNLIGEHTDYNGGQVLPIAIARRTFVAMDVGGAPFSRARSAHDERLATFALDAPTPSGHWSDHIAGTWRAIASGVALPSSLDVAVWSDVPIAAGLSSSAALSVATAAAISALCGAALSPRALALAAFRAESDFVGVPCGIMDQFASAMGATGHALHIHCDTAACELVPMPDALMIFDTAVRRSLRESAFAVRRAECEMALERLRVLDPALPDLAHAPLDLVREARLPSPLDRRARHVSAENARVETAVGALRRGEPVPGELLLASHASLRDDYECSSPELDWFVEHAMRQPGVRGARLTGAGWGGSAIAVGSLDALEAAGERLARAYAGHFSRAASVWISRAGDGVRVDVPPER